MREGGIGQLGTGDAAGNDGSARALKRGTTVAIMLPDECLGAIARWIGTDSTTRFNLTNTEEDVALHLLHRVNRVEVVMNEIVDRVFQDYHLSHSLDAALAAEAREKVSQYVAKLASAGQKDRRRLVVYARAYLKELHEGPDPRFTGC